MIPVPHLGIPLSFSMLFETPWTIAFLAPLSMEFSKQEYCSGLPFPSPDLLTQEWNLCLLHCRQILYCLTHQRSPPSQYTHGQSIFQMSLDLPEFKCGAFFILLYTNCFKFTCDKSQLCFRSCECLSESCSAMSDSLQHHGLWLARLFCPWDSPGKNTGVRSYSLLQGSFLTPGSDARLLHCIQILYHLNQVLSSTQIFFNYYDLMLTQHILFYMCSASDWDKVVKDFLLLLPLHICLCRGLILYKYIILQFYKSEVRHRSYWDKTEISAELYSFPEAFPRSWRLPLSKLMAPSPVFSVNSAPSDVTISRSSCTREISLL